VRRVWKAHSLRLYRMRASKVPNDAEFAESLRDVVGLNIDPPGRTVLRLLDEKSEIRALDRCRLDLPIRMRRARTRPIPAHRAGWRP